MSDNQEYCLKWNNHQNTLVQVINNLFSNEVLVDCTLAAEGQYLHAHKVILCACSPYLNELLSQHYEKYPIIILNDVKFQGLKSMIDYMYKGEVNVPQDEIEHFLKTAELLQVKGLTNEEDSEGDTKDIGFTSLKNNEPLYVEESIPYNLSRSSAVSSHPTAEFFSESQTHCPSRSRESSISAVPQKRRRQRELSQSKEDSYVDNFCQISTQSVCNSISALPSSSSSTTTDVLSLNKDSNNPEFDSIKSFFEGQIEPQSEILKAELKTEYMDKLCSNKSVDLTLDDDYDGMMENGAIPSYGYADGGFENQPNCQRIQSDQTRKDKLRCSHCRVMFSQRSSLQRHIREKHSIEAKQRLYQCELCPFRAKRKQVLIIHTMNIHKKLLA